MLINVLPFGLTFSLSKYKKKRNEIDGCVDVGCDRPEPPQAPEAHRRRKNRHTSTMDFMGCCTAGNTCKAHNDHIIEKCCGVGFDLDDSGNDDIQVVKGAGGGGGGCRT